MQKATYRANTACHLCLRGGFAKDTRFIFAKEGLGMRVRVAGAGGACASRKPVGALGIWVPPQILQSQSQLDQH